MAIAKFAVGLQEYKMGNDCKAYAVGCITWVAITSIVLALAWYAMEVR